MSASSLFIVVGFYFFFLRYLIAFAQSLPLLKIEEEILSNQDPISQLPTEVSMSTHYLGYFYCYLQNYQSSAVLPT